MCTRKLMLTPFPPHCVICTLEITFQRGLREWVSERTGFTEAVLLVHSGALCRPSTFPLPSLWGGGGRCPFSLLMKYLFTPLLLSGMAPAEESVHPYEKSIGNHIAIENLYGYRNTEILYWFKRFSIPLTGCYITVHNCFKVGNWGTKRNWLNWKVWIEFKNKTRYNQWEGELKTGREREELRESEEGERGGESEGKWEWGRRERGV